MFRYLTPSSQCKQPPPSPLTVLLVSDTVKLYNCLLFITQSIH